MCNLSTLLLGLLLIDNYKIKTGDNYTLEAHYNNSGMYSYLDYYDVAYSLTTMQVDSDNFDSGDYSRADFPTIFVAQFVLVIIFYFVLNKLSRLFFKGGL